MFCKANRFDDSPVQHQSFWRWPAWSWSWPPACEQHFPPCQLAHQAPGKPAVPSAWQLGTRPDLWGGQRKHMDIINCSIATLLKATHFFVYSKLKVLWPSCLRIVFPNVMPLFPDKAQRHLSIFRGATQPGVKKDYGLIPDSCF